MRFATLRETGGGTTAAVDLDSDGVWRRLPAPDLSAFLHDGGADGPPAAAAGPVLAAPGQHGPPEPALPLPAPGKVVCCGLNYADHIRETGRELPGHPTLFAKFADTLTGPADEIRLPAGLRPDWEAELAVVVGREVRGAGRAEAAAAIWGYTAANDVSVRSWQHRTLQWLQGKAWDRSTPLGPVVVSADDLDPAAGVEVVCRVDGVERQRGNTRTLVFDPAELVSYISAFTLLRPGDLVLTGTPGGVGAGMTPPAFLSDGALLETEISGIGVLRNRIVHTSEPEL